MLLGNFIFIENSVLQKISFELGFRSIFCSNKLKWWCSYPKTGDIYPKSMSQKNTEIFPSQKMKCRSKFI